MKFLRHLPCLQHPHICGQAAVQCQRQLFQRDSGLGMKVQAERRRVYACIGSAAPFHVRAGTQHRLQRILKHLTDRQAVFLHLKAVVGRAPIGNGTQDVHRAIPCQIHRVESTAAKAARHTARHSQSRAPQCSTFRRVRPSPPR